MLLLPPASKKSIQVQPSLEAYRVRCPDAYVRSIALLIRGDGDEAQIRWCLPPTHVFGQERGCK